MSMRIWWWHTHTHTHAAVLNCTHTHTHSDTHTHMLHAIPYVYKRARVCKIEYTNVMSTIGASIFLFNIFEKIMTTQGRLCQLKHKQWAFWQISNEKIMSLMTATLDRKPQTTIYSVSMVYLFVPYFSVSLANFPVKYT